MKNILISAACAGAALLAFSPVAFAQGFEGFPGTSDFVQNLVAQVPVMDSIADKDQSLYDKLGVLQKFGVVFHNHTRVCDMVADGEAACNARVVTDDKAKPHATPKVVAGNGPSQFLKAYGLTGLATTTKPPVIAIVDAYDDPYIVNDLALYSKTFGIPQLPTCTGPIANSQTPCFQKANQRGSTTQHPFGNAGWALEIALDVETAHAVCQNCSILLVEADSNSYNNLLAAVDRAVILGANVVSNSYGGNEGSNETSYDSHFNHPGVAFTASAGDSGYGVEYPAASQYVTAVGGTSLFLNADGTYNSEVVWSGTGSGCSLYESKPSWQTDSGCSKRMVADVSAVADPNTGAAIYDSYSYFGQRGWFQVGGTSLSAPLIAAVYALSGNIPASTTESSVPYRSASAAYLHDVVSGSNGSCNNTYLCTASTGFDGPTGLGSPLGIGAF